jgi:hypothetical protein
MGTIKTDKWNGCREEECQLWDDAYCMYCMLSEHYHERCKRNGASYHPKASKEQEWEASSEKHEKCRFCDSTETFRKFSIVSLNSKGEVNGSRDIICEPICFNCMKEEALKEDSI